MFANSFFDAVVIQFLKGKYQSHRRHQQLYIQFIYHMYFTNHYNVIDIFEID